MPGYILVSFVNSEVMLKSMYSGVISFKLSGEEKKFQAVSRVVGINWVVFSLWIFMSIEPRSWRFVQNNMLFGKVPSSEFQVPRVM